ncbi:carbon-nitrogen hydrolase [Absidia repens]|uniref:Carbon-nitrogen hydrolase n=1 Tax=Absidia repens TaxID=90262 RepID=A0A1X2I6V5_9FUNG|nr:carbon-nitrogen hydrolase [Absidia repens]
MRNCTHLLLLLTVGAFAIGLQPIPFFTFCFCPILLSYTRQKWVNCLFALISNTIAVSIGTLGVFDDYGTPAFIHLPRVIRNSLVTNLVILSSVLADHIFFHAKNKSAWARVLVFPCVWTSVWYIHGYWGDRSGYSNGISDWSEWAQIADIGGRSLLEFFMALSGTCILECESWMELVLSLKNSTASTSSVTTTSNNNQHAPISASSPSSASDKNLDSSSAIPSSNQSTSFSLIRSRLIKHPFSIYLALVLFVYIYGGAKSSFRKGSFFQRPTKDWVPATQPVACVIGPGGFDMELRSDYSYWMNKSAVAAQNGAKLVLWSEEVVLTNSLQEEQQLRDMAIAVAVEHSIYLVIAYDRRDPVNHNMAVLISPHGDILIDYIKANPLPFDENNEPGPGKLLFADTPEFGRIGIAICFDLSVPSFILQAGQSDVDILLQPAYNWGAGGPSNLRNQQLRAVENGFTLFRCISQGISGVIEPVIHGHFEQKTAVISNEVVLFNLPIQKRIKTIYSHFIGDTIPYGCMLFSLAFFLTSLFYSQPA